MSLRAVYPNVCYPDKERERESLSADVVRRTSRPSAVLAAPTVHTDHRPRSHRRRAHAQKVQRNVL